MVDEGGNDFAKFGALRLLNYTNSFPYLRWTYPYLIWIWDVQIWASGEKSELGPRIKVLYRTSTYNSSIR